ncbi:MAG: hypothetical protein ACOX00_08445 [Peptoniphilaceae bacterium]
MNKTWMIEIGKKTVPIHLQMNRLQTHLRLEAEGHVLLEKNKAFRILTGDVLSFSYKGHTFELLVHGPYVDIVMDGISQSYRRPVQALEAFPIWVVPWFSLCLMLPVYTQAGLIPLLLAFAGMWGISILSRIPLFKPFTRFFISMCIALAAWLLYFGLAMLLSGTLFTNQ